MTSTSQVDRYLEQFRQRLVSLNAARGFAAMAVAAMLITVAAVTVAIRTGFPPDLLIAARLLLLAALAGLLVFRVILPGRRIRENGTADIEARTPEFSGRIETYGELRDTGNPMRELLAGDALEIANRHPPAAQVPQREFSLAYSIAAVAVAALLYLAIAGPGNYSWGVRHLWAGWAISGLLPPQGIEVRPGDDGIRAGGTVRVEAVPRGFAPGEAWVHASFAGGEWQRVEMAPADGAFEFTFFSVREPFNYYVTAANVRSPTYEIRVVDLPDIDSLVTVFRYPEWTGRAPETHDPGGDIRTIAATEVDVEIRADGPMTPAVLVVDDQEIPMAIDGDSGRASLTVAADGRYFVAATVGGERIRLTDDYFISVLEDEGPDVEFTQPGRDWSASPIEEVTARISAKDDFAIESLELRYSVNGGAWRSVALPAGDGAVEESHVFLLESLTRGDDDQDALVPGDLVSYYAVAADRESEARTDIFFIDVQPFDRRYSQSQQSGGGQQGGAQQDEISKRQREIIVSTWNLIREQQENRRGDDDWVPNNAALLSRLQTTLKEQAETLAERTRARELSATNEEIAEFVDNLNRAAVAMVPAAERLAEIELEQAILPEQEALQHLLRAEAVFTDISLSLQANNRGGRGGQAGRDLTDMFELEMDLEKNQYETGSRATPEAPQQQLDEVRDELEELARRQERLAQNAGRTSTPTPAERWQQEMLRRDVEELRERLERAQQASNRSGQQGGQSGQDPGSPASSGDESQSRQNDELRRRLESAARAMREADEAMQGGADAESRQRAAAEAQRQLEGARDQADAERDRMVQASLGELADRAGELHDRQAAIERELQDAIRDVMVGTNELDRLDSGMTFDEEYEMAETKRRLQADLQTLDQDARTASRELRDSEPLSAEKLEDALDDLREEEVEARMAVSAAYIEQGEAVYVAGSESAITEALRQFRESLREAESLAGGATGRPGRDGRDGLSGTLAETRQLREELQRLADAGAREGNAANRGRDDLQRSTGVRVPDLDTQARLERAMETISDDVLRGFRDLRAAGVPPQDIDELRRLAGEVRAAEFSGNPDILARESRAALTLVEQLELALAEATRPAVGGVRTNETETIPENRRESIANYYRRLGETQESAER